MTTVPVAYVRSTIQTTPPLILKFNVDSTARHIPAYTGVAPRSWSPNRTGDFHRIRLSGADSNLTPLLARRWDIVFGVTVRVLGFWHVRLVRCTGFEKIV